MKAASTSAKTFEMTTLFFAQCGLQFFNINLRFYFFFSSFFLKNKLLKFMNYLSINFYSELPYNILRFEKFIPSLISPIALFDSLSVKTDSVLFLYYFQSFYFCRMVLHCALSEKTCLFVFHFHTMYWIVFRAKPDPFYF